MDIRIDGAHEVALERLQRHYSEKNAVVVARHLIYRDAKRLGLWPNGTPSDDLEPVYDENGAAG